MKVIYELGDRVSFSKHLVKNEAPNLEKLLEEDEVYEYDFQKYKYVEHNEMSGIIVGKRNIGKTSHLSYEENSYNNEFNWVCTDTDYQTVYLVATNMSGFNRVKEEDMSIVGE